MDNLVYQFEERFSKLSSKSQKRVIDSIISKESLLTLAELGCATILSILKVFYPEYTIPTQLFKK